MKKVLFSLAVVAAFTFAACGNAQTEEATEDTTATAVVEEEVVATEAEEAAAEMPAEGEVAAEATETPAE